MSIRIRARAPPRVLVILFALFASHAYACSATQQDLFYVGDKSSDVACSYNTIQEAITAATCAAGTKIYLTGELTYTAQHLGISGKNVTLIGRGSGSHCGPELACGPFVACPTAPLATISGSGHSGDSVITIRGASNVRLQYLTISDGQDTADGSGGGIDYDGAGALTLDTSTVSGNTAGYGGGINIKGTAGEATLTLMAHTLIVANTAGFSGGGIRLEGTSRLFALGDSTEITSNHALAGYGGGIAILGPARADIGSPGYVNNGVVAFNDAHDGGGIAVIDNGNGEAALRTFAYGPTGIATRIQGNVGYFNGGGIYLQGDALACLFASRIESNTAGEGAAIYAEFNYGVFINGGFPGELGTDCGPEPIAQLGGATECSPATPCNTFNGNRTQNGDASFSPGAVIHAYSYLVGSRFRVQHNEAAYAISAPYADIRRCLVTDNHVTDALIRAAHNASATAAPSFDACTIAHNTIDGAYVFDFTDQTAPALSRNIIDEPGHSSAYFTPYHPGNVLSVSYTMTADAGLLDPANPTIVQGVPNFVREWSDYHLSAFAQTALDFAPALGDVDLEGVGGAVDLPVVANKYGVSDLGAYERQNLFNDCGNSDTLYCDGFEN